MGLTSSPAWYVWPGKPVAAAITAVLERTFLDRVVLGLGLVVTLYDILEACPWRCPDAAPALPLPDSAAALPAAFHRRFPNLLSADLWWKAHPILMHLPPPSLYRWAMASSHPATAARFTRFASVSSSSGHLWASC